MHHNRQAHTVEFTKQDASEIAAAINGLIAKARAAAAAISSARYEQVKRDTPGPTKVRLGIWLVLANEKFSYAEMKFKRPAWSTGFCAMLANKFVVAKAKNGARDAVDKVLDSLPEVLKPLVKGMLDRIPSIGVGTREQIVSTLFAANALRRAV